MREIGIENLNTLTILSNSDVIHVLQENGDNSVLLSYKSTIADLNSILIKKEEIANLHELLRNLRTRLENFIKTFDKKERVDAVYVSKEKRDNIIPSFLTVQNFEQILAKYAIDLDLRDKENLDRKEGAKMFDEMTDFAGAAMVGINQSSAAPVETTPTE